MLNISEKKELVERLTKDLAESQIAILVDYKGLDVQAMTDLRARLRKEGAQIEVVKNTLMTRASEGSDAALMKDFFKGPNAVVISKTDPVSPAKVLTEFTKDNEKLEIKAGAMAGKLLDTAQLEQLAKMPSRDQLLGQLAGVLNAVPTSFVNVLAGVPRAFVNVLNAYKEQKEAA